MAVPSQQFILFSKPSSLATFDIIHLFHVVTTARSNSQVKAFLKQSLHFLQQQETDDCKENHHLL